MAQMSIRFRTGWIRGLLERAVARRRQSDAEPVVFSRPIAGTDSRMTVLDEEFSPVELLAMERRRCMQLQRENTRLRHLCDRLGLRVQILEQV